MDEWILSWLYQHTHSAVSRSISRNPCQFRPRPAGVMHSVLYSPIVDSINALSSASPIVPIDPGLGEFFGERQSSILRTRVRMVHQSPRRELAVGPPPGRQRLGQRRGDQISGLAERRRPPENPP